MRKRNLSIYRPESIIPQGIPPDRLERAMKEIEANLELTREAVENQRRIIELLEAIGLKLGESEGKSGD